ADTDDAQALGLELVRQHRGLRRLAAPVHALEADEHGVMLPARMALQNRHRSAENAAKIKCYPLAAYEQDTRHRREAVRRARLRQGAARQLHGPQGLP